MDSLFGLTAWKGGNMMDLSQSRTYVVGLAEAGRAVPHPRLKGRGPIEAAPTQGNSRAIPPIHV